MILGRRCNTLIYIFFYFISTHKCKKEYEYNQRSAVFKSLDVLIADSYVFKN